ncbi:MAG: hypothetical protein INQ03_09930 [Candidatus Heimdallarchaeota archaeon]|nr:hypothetical protein [Candidatus Heimdallarchaeota archaeon]
MTSILRKVIMGLSIVVLLVIILIDQGILSPLPRGLSIVFLVLMLIVLMLIAKFYQSKSPPPEKQSTRLLLDGKVTRLVYQHDLLCQSCGEKFGMHLTTCPQCLTEAPNCPICYRGFSTGEEVLVLPCCTSHLHTSDIDLWVRSGSAQCPVCRRSLRMLIWI